MPRLFGMMSQCGYVVQVRRGLCAFISGSPGQVWAFYPLEIATRYVGELASVPLGPNARSTLFVNPTPRRGEDNQTTSFRQD